MASNFSTCSRPTELAALLPLHKHKHPLGFTLRLLTHSQFVVDQSRGGFKRSLAIRVSNDGDSYLDMWQKAVDRERKAVEFQKIAENTAGDGDGGESPEVLERKTSEFQMLLEVSAEERDRVQRMQVIDRAAAAIAATRALIKENLPPPPTVEDSGDMVSENIKPKDSDVAGDEGEDEQNSTIFISSPGDIGNATPGPSFWSWTPPPDTNNDPNYENAPNPAKQTSPSPIQATPVMELDRSIDILSIPLESKLENKHDPPLPPLQSLMEVEKANVSDSVVENRELDIQFSEHAQNAARALEKVDEALSQGVYEDGTRWWKETGTEVRTDGVVCRWTLMRGVSADMAVEWEEKYWEAADELEYKELGSEKSGRDSSGNVWREYWKESMYKDNGFLHMEKTADKWGKNGKGDEWQEKWWEGYGASGQAEKWAHKWCSIDPNTQLDAGHAHVWHERWGEKYDGQGGSTKYTDKWAERCEGDRWTKWGDKWDENFNPYGQGVKQGETWWEGKYGERWNRTWGEGHNGTGWVHKYGKSSSGEHWDTHEEQDTWYERYPHFGFYHCFENSVQLRQVKKPSESESAQDM